MKLAEQLLKELNFDGKAPSLSDAQLKELSTLSDAQYDAFSRAVNNITAERRATSTNVPKKRGDGPEYKELEKKGFINIERFEHGSFIKVSMGDKGHSYRGLFIPSKRSK